MKKIYIAGCGGMLGQAFYDEFKDAHELRCTDKDVNEPWLSFLDFRDAASYARDVLAFKPDFLFHLGALTDLEYCEANPDDAYWTNALAVEDAVNIANHINVPIFYVGTAGIFDGEKKFYDDWDTPNPLGVYARTKWIGERTVVENAKRYLICRAGWMMGGGLKDKKFVRKILKQIAKGKDELFVVADKGGTPTYTVDFAKNVRLLVDRNFGGVYNMACGGLTSRFSVAAEMLNILGLDDKIKLTPVASSFFASEYSAPRPDCERLINRKLDLRGVNIMRPWQEALKEYLTLDKS